MSAKILAVEISPFLRQPSGDALEWHVTPHLPGKAGAGILMLAVLLAFLSMVAT